MFVNGHSRCYSILKYSGFGISHIEIPSSTCVGVMSCPICESMSVEKDRDLEWTIAMEVESSS